MEAIENPPFSNKVAEDEYKVEDDPICREAQDAYKTNLWSNLRNRLRRAEFFLLPGRRDLAMKYLRHAREFCAEYDGDEAMYSACQDTEDIILLWPSTDGPTQRSRLKRRTSDSHLPMSDPTKFSFEGREAQLGDFHSQITTTRRNIVRSSSDDWLFRQLMHDLQKSGDTDTAASKKRHTPKPPPLDLKTSPKHVTFDVPSAAAQVPNFEPIESLLPRLRDGREKENSEVQQGAPSQPEDAMLDRVNGWERQLPNSPSQSKDSEGSSSRRQSSPHASPTLSSPTARIRHRKGSIHSVPQPLAHDIDYAPHSPLRPTASPDWSISNYSHRYSQDETSTILSDTPSIAKLAIQLDMNPFTESESPSASRVRKLSTEDPLGVALSIDIVTQAEHSNSPPRSPLSQILSPDDLLPLPSPAPVASPPGPTRSRRTPPPLPLSSPPPRRQSSSNVGSSPHTPSPLREQFLPADRISTEVDKSPEQALCRQPSSSLTSRIPRLTKTSTNPPSPEHTANGSANGSDPPLPVTTTPVPSADSKVSQSDTAITPKPATCPPAPSTSISSPPQDASPIADPASVKSQSRRRDASSRVSRMAARFETLGSHDQRGGNANFQHGSTKGNTKPLNNAVRPPWQVPGKAKAMAGTLGLGHGL